MILQSILAHGAELVSSALCLPFLAGSLHAALIGRSGFGVVTNTRTAGFLRG